MNKIQAEENIKLIREIMERSTRYTSFTGLSGIVAGMLALIGCAATAHIYLHIPPKGQNTLYFMTWFLVLVLAIAQDLMFAQRKAKRKRETIFSPPTYQAMKAMLPGVFIAFVISMRALTLGEPDAIPAIWTLGYGAALCSAGIYTVREVRIFGAIQLLTGTIGLFLWATAPNSLYLLATTFGVYHIIYGLWMTRKYGW